VIKSAALSVKEFPSMNGHVLWGYFYKSKTPGVDVSVSMDVGDSKGETSTQLVRIPILHVNVMYIYSTFLLSVLLKICDAEAKPVDVIADELQERTKKLRDKSSVAQVEEPAKSGEVPALPSQSRKARILNMLPIPVRMEADNLFNFIGSGLGIDVPFLGITSYPLGVCSVITAPNRDNDDVDMAGKYMYCHTLYVHMYVH
jgi:hypothetical protein